MNSRCNFCLQGQALQTVKSEVKIAKFHDGISSAVENKLPDHMLLSSVESYDGSYQRLKKLLDI